MGALGQFGSAIGQGFLQGRQYRDEQQRLAQQQGLQERLAGYQGQQVDLARQGQESDIKNRDREFAYRRIKDYEGIANSPDFKTKYPKAKQDAIVSSLDKLYAQYPEFDLRGQPSPVTPTPVQAPAPPQPAPPQPGPQPGQPPVAQPPQPAGPSAWARGWGQQPDITDEQVSSLMRETDPNYNIAQNERRAAMQPPAPPAKQRQPPAKPQATDEQMPLDKQNITALEQQANELFQMAKDPQFSTEQQIGFRREAAAALAQAAQLRQAGQSYRIGAIKEKYAEPEAEMGLAGAAEDIAGKKADRTVFKPRQLQLDEEANAIKLLAQQLDAAEKGKDRARQEAQFALEVQKFGLNVKEFKQKLINDAIQNGYTMEQIKKLRNEPGFWMKLHSETLAKNAYIENPISGEKKAGPTFDAYNQLVPPNAVTPGTVAPGLPRPAVPGTEGHIVQTKDGREFRVQSYLEDPNISWKLKVQGLKKYGLKPPKWLLAKAAAEK